MPKFHDEENRKNIQLLRGHLKEMPAFVAEFFRNKTDYSSSLTRLGYAYDLKLFFNFLVTETLEFSDKTAKELTLEDIGRIEVFHIEEFMEYLSYYIRYSEKDGEIIEKEVSNAAEGKSRKLSAVKSMFAYFHQKGKVQSNPAELVSSLKLKEKAKIYLDVNEIANLLDEVDAGESLTPKQRDYHIYNRSRDLALLSLFAGTGIRISEAVGLNLNDVNLEDESFRVVRKGGAEAILYFGPEVKEALAQYFVLRKQKKPKEGHEDALFLSLQNRRITPRAVQNLVKKYTSAINSLKNITPHKLRTSFGTNMYRQTGDIYLVADLLGHKDVNTTKKHYADTKDEAGRKAVRNYRLRED